MLELISNFTYILGQTANEKKLTVLYLMLFFLFLLLLFLDAKTKKEYTGPVIVKNTIIFLLFATGVALLLVYIRMY